MEELFNRPILDQLYDSISDDFETMLLKKKNLDGKFTESLKVEEELINLIKKVVKENFDKSVEFIDTPPAEQYRESLLLRAQANANT